MQLSGTELETPSQSRSAQPPATVRTAVAGVGGYAGGALARPVVGESKARFVGRIADGAPGGRVPLEQVHPQLALGAGQQRPEIVAFNWKLIREAGTEIVFLAQIGRAHV